MKNNKLKLILLMMIFITIWGLTTKISSIEAATPTKEEVYNNVPDGLKLNGLIEHPDYSGGTNDAKLLENYPVNIVEMLSENGNSNQISSFWGKKYSDTANTKLYNSFRLDKPQTISAWIYFGDTYHYYSDDTSGGKDSAYDGNKDSNKTSDGIALVLQDDSRGAAAISTAIGGTGKGNPSFGETLGVWAGSTSDHTPLGASKTLGFPAADFYDNLFTTAIQKSFALEMDAVQNYKKPTLKTNLITQEVTGKDDYFDANSSYKGQHITSGYPGVQDTYLSDGGTYNLNKRYYYFSQSYQTGTSNNIEMTGYSGTPSVDKAWRHLTFHYYPPTSSTSRTASFKYSFNDQNPDGTAAGFNLKNSGSGSIDLNKVTDSNDIRWGFTASTGSQYSAPRTYAIIMQQMPNTANIEDTARLFDMSQYDDNGELGREISDLAQNSSFNPSSSNPLQGFTNKSAYNVANNDKLLFQYDLNYTSGTIGTGEIQAKLRLPKYVDFKPGVSNTVGSESIGKVVYSGNGADTSKSFEIAASDITTDSEGNQTLVKTLPDMNTEGQHVTAYIYGLAQATTTPQLVNGAATSYRSDYFIADVTTPYFIINDQLQIASTTTDQEVTSDKDVTIDGTINYVNKSTFDSKGIQMHTKINGTDIGDSSANTTTGATTGDYTMIASSAISSGSPLKVGKNTIEVYATDSLSRVSNKITYTINVKDYKDLQIKATGDDPQTVRITDPIKLTHEVSYSNGDDLELKKLHIYLKIDDGDYQEVSLGGGSNTEKPAQLLVTLPAGQLSVGEHKVKLYYNDEVRDSNEIEYNIIVIDRELILTPTTSDQDQTVSDNSDVKIRGNYAYSDDTDFDNDVTEVKYQITNADGTQQATVSQAVTSQLTNKGEFSITLAPIGAQLLDNNSQQAVDDYLKTATGLKVGRNEITVTAYDGTTASNSATYIINVPDITPTISTNDTDLTAISNIAVRLPMTFTYPDSNGAAYSLQANDTAVFTQLADSTEVPVMTLADRPNKTAGQVNTPYQLNPQTNWTSGIDAGKYQIQAYVMDRYLRKTNILDYNLNVLATGAQVEVDNYRFKTIDPRGKVVPKYVQREGNWGVKVDSYKSKWILQAQADNMKRQDNDGNYTESSNLEMVHLNDVSGTPISLSTNPIVASGDSTSSATPVSYSLFNESSPNTGILLGTRGVPLSGEYQSLVTWSIKDSI